MVFTHQNGLVALNEFKPVKVGSRVYVGAGCRLLPGTTVGAHIVIGAGSIVGCNLLDSYHLYASPRAIPVKQLRADMPYFTVERPAGPNPGGSAWIAD